MLRIGGDREGFFIIRWSDGANISNRICEVLDMTIRRFNMLVRKNNGIVERDGKDSCGWCYRHRFKFHEDCEKFLKALEPYVIMAKLIK